VPIGSAEGKMEKGVPTIGDNVCIQPNATAVVGGTFNRGWMYLLVPMHL
jgi:serine acetyltransferase